MVAEPKERAFDHIIVMVFENQYRSYVLQNPYMRKLADQGVMLAGAYGVMHPSQTNYIAAVAGELCNVTGDGDISPALTQRMLVDVLEEAGLSWKAYMESYRVGSTPWKPGVVPKDDYPYVVKHNPFVSFESVRSSPERWARIDNEAGFWSDVLNGTLPHFSWFTPNMWNDGHFITGTEDEPEHRAPGLIDQLAIWLEGFFGKLKFPGPDSYLPEKTLVLVMFDESDFESEYNKGNKSDYDGPNQIYAVLLGEQLTPAVEEQGYNHYSLIKTIEVNFGLETLHKNDKHANWYKFLWGRRFAWGTPRDTAIEARSMIAAAGHGRQLTVAWREDDGAIALRDYRCDSGAWQDEAAVDGAEVQRSGLRAGGALALAYCGDALMLAFHDAGALRTAVRLPDGAWRVAEAALAEAAPGEDVGEQLALVAFDDGSRLMLAWTSAAGGIYTSVYQAGAWAEPVDTGYRTGGALTLAQLGSTLLLLFENREHGHIEAVSYNTASFNVVSLPSAPWNDTTEGQWSPSSCPVARFGTAPDPATPGEPEPELLPYPARGPLAAATLDGVVHLVFGQRDGEALLATSFSLSGLLTPKLKVAYKEHEDETSNSGFGTLAEAGWNPQRPLPQMACAEGGAVALAQLDGAIALLVRDGADGPLRLAAGVTASDSATA